MSIFENIGGTIKEQACYGYANLNFLLAFNNKEMEKKFLERVYPFINKSNKCDSIDFELNITIDDVLYKILSKKQFNGNEFEEVIVSYCSKESGMVRAKKCYVDNHIFIKTSRECGFWIIDNTFKKIVFVGNQDCIEHFHREFYVFFEHVLVKKAEEKGAILLHAAAVEKEGRVILLMGKKRSGKTTTFFELCKYGGCVPLSVDKILLVPENEEYMVYGVPTRLRVLSGTLSKYKELYHFIPDKYKNVSQEVLWRGQSDGKVEIPIGEFEKFIKKEFRIRGVLKTIVFNQVLQSEDYYKLSLGLGNDSEKILLENIFSPFNPEEDWWSEIGIRKVEQINDLRDEMIEILKQKIQFINYRTQKDFTALINTL